MGVRPFSFLFLPKLTFHRRLTNLISSTTYFDASQWNTKRLTRWIAATSSIDARQWDTKCLTSSIAALTPIGAHRGRTDFIWPTTLL